MPPVFSKNINALLRAHQYQGLLNNCGPFCAAIVLGAIGEQIQGEKLSQELNIPRWRCGLPFIRRIPNWATFPWGLVDGFKMHGVNAQWKMMVSKSSLNLAFHKDIILIVIIGSVIPLWAHTLILVAADDVKGWGFIDPAVTRQEIQWLSNQYFSRHWSILGRNVIYIYNS
jgi:hypothetical protein